MPSSSSSRRAKPSNASRISGLHCSTLAAHAEQTQLALNQVSPLIHEVRASISKETVTLDQEIEQVAAELRSAEIAGKVPDVLKGLKDRMAHLQHRLDIRQESHPAYRSVCCIELDRCASMGSINRLLCALLLTVKHMGRLGSGVVYVPALMLVQSPSEISPCLPMHL